MPVQNGPLRSTLRREQLRQEITQVPVTGSTLTLLMTADEVAAVLRTSREAVYAMASRGQLPGLTRLGRRLLFRGDLLVDWLDQNRTPSPKE